MEAATKMFNFIKDVEFPVSREDLIDYAEEHDIPQDVLDRLEDLPERMYESYFDVIKELVM